MGSAGSRPMSSSQTRERVTEASTNRPFSSSGLRLSFSLHDIRNPWAGNTNMINGFYQEPDTSHPPGEYRYLDARRQRKEREVENLANGINFQYTSPFMTDRHSLVKQNCNTNEGRFSN